MKLHALRTPLTISAALLATSVQMAFAQEATPDKWMTAPDVKAHSEVRAEVAAARAAGDLDTLSAYRLADRSHVSTLTRAQVIGDVQMYRESGLAALDGGEATDFTTTQYAAAQGRYAQLRLSLEVAALERQSAGHEASGPAK